MAICVKDIMKLESLSKLKLVAGVAGIEKIAEWVYVAECFEDPVESIKWIQGHEIVIITGHGIKDDKDVLVNVIKAINDKKGAALVINIGSYIQKIPEEALKLANELEIPLFELPWEVKIVEISREICKAILYSRIDRNSIMYLLSDILFGDRVVKENTVEKVAYYGHDLSGKCNICVAYIDNLGQYVEDNNINSIEAISQIKVNVIKILQDGLDKYNLKSPIIEKGDSIIIFNKTDENRMKRLKIALKEVQENINNKIGGLTISLGIGNSYDDLNQMKKSLKEAEWALQSAKFENKNNIVITYKEIGVYGLLFNIKDKSILEQYYFNMLGEVQKYDNMNDTELIKTLEVYLDESCNVTLTADALYLHRNTLKYRLRKIEELLECDLHNFKDCERLQIAFDIKKIIM